MYIFNGKKIEVKNIQITKIDQMIVFYNDMWSIIAHSCIWGHLGAGSLTFIDRFSTDKKTVEYKNEQLSTT